MFNAARMHGDSAVSFREPMSRLLDRFRRYTGHFAGCARIVACNRCLNSIEAGGVLGDEKVVLQIIAQDHMQHAVEQRQICAGTERQEEIGIARDGRHTWIGNDQPAPCCHGTSRCSPW